MNPAVFQMWAWDQINLAKQKPFFFIYYKESPFGRHVRLLPINVTINYKMSMSNNLLIT